jgi:hypothetical protein
MEANVQKAHSRRRWRQSVTDANATANGLRPEDEWHPLDGRPAPEHVPEYWTGPHVGLRLVQAFKTLANMPDTRTGSSRGFWPAYFYEWDDLLAQQQSDAQSKDDAASALNRAKIRPSARDVSRMEQAISWPGRYCTSVPCARIVQRVAFYRSRDMDAHMLARKMRLDPKSLRKRNREGLDIIAIGLRRDKVRVF